MSEIEVYAPGSDVLIDGVISARIIAVLIEEKGISYQCVWWNERERKIEWLAASEVRADDEKTQSLKVNPIL